MDSFIDLNSSLPSAVSVMSSQNLDSSSFYLMTDYSSRTSCSSQNFDSISSNLFISPPNSGHGMEKQGPQGPIEPYWGELKLFAREALKKHYQTKMCEIEETVAELLMERDTLRQANKKQRSKMSKAMSENEEKVSMGHAFIDELNTSMAQLQEQAKLHEELISNLKEKNSAIKSLRHVNKEFEKLREKDYAEVETLKAEINDVKSLLKQRQQSKEQLARKQRSEAKHFRELLHNEEKKRKALVSELEQVAEEISECTMFREQMVYEEEQGLSNHLASEYSYSGSNLMTKDAAMDINKAKKNDMRNNDKVKMHKGRMKRVSVGFRKPRRADTKNETHCV